MLAEQMLEIRVGSRVKTRNARAGRPGKSGEVVEVVRERGHERCRVRWDDDSETLVYPGIDLDVERRSLDDDLLVS